MAVRRARVARDASRPEVAWMPAPMAAARRANSDWPPAAADAAARLAACGVTVVEVGGAVAVAAPPLAGAEVEACGWRERERERGARLRKKTRARLGRQ